MSGSQVYNSLIYKMFPAGDMTNPPYTHYSDGRTEDAFVREDDGPIMPLVIPGKCSISIKIGCRPPDSEKSLLQSANAGNLQPVVETAEKSAKKESEKL